MPPESGQSLNLGFALKGRERKVSEERGHPVTRARHGRVLLTRRAAARVVLSSLDLALAAQGPKATGACLSTLTPSPVAALLPPLAPYFPRALAAVDPLVTLLSALATFAAAACAAHPERARAALSTVALRRAAGVWASHRQGS
jgi:hypothetical protein